MALEMAILSHAAYDNGEVFGEWYDRVDYFEHEESDTEAYVVSSPGIAVVVIRGSDSYRDWWWNIRKVRRSVDGVHRGFIESAEGLLDAGLLDFLIDYEGDIHFAGHSKGGAISQILAAGTTGVSGVWCFGTPRVGCRDWARRYRLSDITHSFSTRFDPVVHLPPVFLGYWRAVALERLAGWGHAIATYIDGINRKT
jgi:hypothetical protein